MGPPVYPLSSPHLFHLGRMTLLLHATIPDSSTTTVKTSEGDEGEWRQQQHFESTAKIVGDVYS
jgi:hypothetical protein